VRARWNPRQVAERFLHILKGEVPQSWLFDPRHIRYCYGYGLPADKVKDRIARVIREGGRQALRLTDKPELEQRLCDFAMPAE